MKKSSWNLGDNDMKTLRNIHIVLGVITIPFILFICLTGIWQLYGLHYIKKEGSAYTPPHPISTMHTQKALKVDNHYASQTGKYIMTFATLGIILNTLSGLTMAFKFLKKTPFILCLIIGFLSIFMIYIFGSV
jgi:hypothetical protein